VFSFCRQIENVNNLFFTCPIARVVWGVLGNLFGTNTCPNSLCNILVLCLFTRRVENVYGGDCCYLLGIWIIRNKVTFDEYTLKSPIEVVFIMCSFLLYWVGLQANDDNGKVLAVLQSRCINKRRMKKENTAGDTRF
jgi:hypothetical protein